MRSTCLGARSGRSPITTWPLLVSMISVFSGSFLGCMRDSVGYTPLPHADGSAMSFLVGQQVDFLHFVGLWRRLAARDLVDILHAGDHLAPQRVLPGELPAAVAEADEELAIGTVGIAGARRPDAAAFEWLLAELRRQIRQL